MEIEELRVKNLVIYEACTYKVEGVNIIGVPKLNVKAVNHKWGIELCSPAEVSGIELTPEILKKNGFVVLNKGIPDIWTKQLEGNRYIRYHSKVHYVDFETTNSFSRVPWPVKFLHQMQNATTDYGLKIEFLA